MKMLQQLTEDGISFTVSYDESYVILRTEHMEAVRLAVIEERERCAEIVDSCGDSCTECIDAIRCEKED